MRFKIGKYDIRIDWFKSKEEIARLNKFDAYKREAKMLELRRAHEEKMKKHNAFLKRVREGHLVHLARLKQIKKARKLKPAPVKHVGYVDENPYFMDQYEATMWKRNAANPYQIFEANLAYYKDPNIPQPELDEAIEECSFQPSEEYAVIDVEFVFDNYKKLSATLGLQHMELNNFLLSIQKLFPQAVMVRSSKKEYIVGPACMFKSLHADEKKR